MTGTCTVGSGGVALACSSLFYFSVPALLGIVFLSCKVVEIVKVGSSTLLGKLSFRHGFMSRFTSLGLFTFARVGCLLQLWIKTSDLGDAQIMIKKPPDIFLIVHSFSYPFGDRKNICTYYLLNNWYTTNTNLPPFVVFRGIKFQS